MSHCFEEQKKNVMLSGSKSQTVLVSCKRKFVNRTIVNKNNYIFSTFGGIYTLLAKLSLTGGDIP